MVLVHGLTNADAFDVVVLQFVFLPWIVGPAALAAFFVARTWTTAREKWAFVLAEAGVVASTAWLWINLQMHPDAQNGIAMFLFPVVQFAAVLAFALVVTLVNGGRKRRRKLAP